MSAARPEIAIFNLERTIVDNVFQNAVSDLVATELMPAYDTLPHTERSARDFLAGWMMRKPIDALEPLLGYTTEQTDARLAGWARVVLKHEMEVEHRVGLYSATAPQALLEAYAAGLRDSIYGLEVEFVRGKPYEVEDGRYTGDRGEFLKAEAIEALRQDGRTIYLIADSFGGAWPAIKYGGKRIAVNPDWELQHDDDLPHLDLLYWEANHPNEVAIRPADAERTQKIDLNRKAGRRDLLEALKLTA